jgi:hypothetical protein
MLVVVPVVTLDEDVPVLVHRRYWSRALHDSPQKLRNYQIGLGKAGGLMTLGINGWGAKRTEPADTNGFPQWRQIVPPLPKIPLPPDARNLGLNAALLWRAQQAIGSEHGLCLTITSRTTAVIVEPLGSSRQNGCLVPPYAVIMPMYLAEDAKKRFVEPWPIEIHG